MERRGVVTIEAKIEDIISFVGEKIAKCSLFFYIGKILRFILLSDWTFFAIIFDEFVTGCLQRRILRKFVSTYRAIFQCSMKITVNRRSI